MVEMVALKKLKLLDRNPRTITAPQMQKLMDKLTAKPEFLWDNPIQVNVIDGVYHVYGGNQRVRAARKLKWKEIPCAIAFDLSEKEVKERVVELNAHVGRFDWDMLANDYDIDFLKGCGFTDEELQVDSTPVEVDDEEPEPEEEKVKYCPHCNGII